MSRAQESSTRAGALLLVSLATAGCAAVPRTPAYRDGVGWAHCQAVEQRAAKVSTINGGWAWAFTVAAAGLVTTGGIVGPGDQGADSVIERQRGVFLTSAGALLVPIAYYLFSRADAASEAASQATLAFKEPDERIAYEKCVSAQAGWVSSRGASNSLAMGRDRFAARDAQVEVTEAVLDKLLAPEVAKEAEIEAADAMHEAGEAIKAAAATAEAKADAERKIQEAVAARAAAEESLRALRARLEETERHLQRLRSPVEVDMSDAPIPPP